MSMSIHSYFANSCAASVITMLSDNRDAHAAMLAFCRAELGFAGGLGSSRFQTLVPHYVFVAGPEVAQWEPGGSHHSKKWTRYGTEFAALIVEKGLGLVATTGPTLNVKYHESSTCQVWIFTPNQIALEAWYRAALETTKAMAKKPTSPVETE